MYSFQKSNNITIISKGNVNVDDSTYGNLMSFIKPTTFDMQAKTSLHENVKFYYTINMV